MIVDATHEPLPASADVAIVGSGAVGLPVAVDLARSGLNVLVLEAGGHAPSDGSQAFFDRAENLGVELRGLHTGRFRCLGGTTNFWGGQLAPLDACVFDERPWIDPLGWPIARQDLDPYYQAAYSLLGMDDRIAPDRDVWKRLGVSLPDDTQALALFVTTWARTRNFAVLFDKELSKRPNLTVAVHSPVTGFFVEGDGSRVGLSVRTPAGQTHRISAGHIVLANGTVEIARLLQMPLANGARAPWAGNEWIGRGFMDHLECSAGLVRPIDKKRFHAVFDNAFISGIKYSPKLKLTCEAQRALLCPGIAAHLMFNSSFSEHVENAKIFFRALLRGRFERGGLRRADLLSGMRFALPMIVRYLRYRRIYNFADLGIHLRLVCEQKPIPDSRITLAGACDALGMPYAQVDWKIDGAELDGLASFAELVRTFMLDNGLADVDLDPRLMARDRTFLSAVEDTNHHMGGARMALRPADGVVDQNLRVFGSENLHVAGAAVFPTSGFANPTLTGIVFGLRLADNLKRHRRVA